MDGDYLNLLHRTHVLDPRLDHAEGEHLKVVDDFWVRKDPIGVVPVDESIIKIIYAFGIELILLNEFTLLIDAVPRLDHGLFSWSAILRILLTYGQRFVQLLQGRSIVGQGVKQLRSFDNS